MSENVLKAKAELYQENRTLTFIKLKSGSLFNGYIVIVKETCLILQDRYIKLPFPVLFAEIDKLEASREEAW